MSASISHGLVVPAHYFAIGYSIIVGTGLLMALVLGMRLHFSEIVKTHCKTEEYWPSISATTGDFAPERFIWRIAFVLSALFRFTTGFMTFKFFSQQEAVAPGKGDVVSTRSLIAWELVCEILRCVSALGWTIISSGEDNLHHNASFGVYMAVGFILQVSQVVIVGRLRGTYANGGPSLSLKKVCLIGQTVCALSVAFFYMRHHQTCAPGAYSRSTMCEWMFAFFNVLFDASQGYELQNERVAFGVSGGEPHVLKLSSVPSNTIMMVSDVFFGYLTVASTLQLMQVVYFVPMVAMEFTWEVGLIIGVGAPVLFYIPRFRRFVEHQKIYGAHMYVGFYFLAVLSLFSIDVTRNAGQKIVVSSIGCISVLLAIFGRLYCTPSLDVPDIERSRMNFSIPLGFAVSMMLRMMFASVDPLYVSPMYNAFLGLVFGMWCVFVQYRRSAFALPSTSSSDNKSGHAAEEEGKPAQSAAAFGASPALVGLAFGGCMSLSLVMVSSPGFIARLVGMEPWPSSAVVIAVYLAGLYFSPLVVPARGPRGGTGVIGALSSAPLLVALYVCGFLVLLLGTRQSNRTFETHHSHYPITYETPREHVKLSDWVTEEDFRGSPALAFCGGLAVVFAIGATWPVITVAVASNRRPLWSGVWRSMELSYTAVLIVTLLAHVYVVCFPFVPLGWLLRDRLDIVLGGTIALTLLASLALRKQLDASSPGPALVPEVVLGAALEDAPSTSSTSKKKPLLRGVTCTVALALLAFLVICIMGRIVGAPDDHSIDPSPLLRVRGKEVLELSQKLLQVQIAENKLDDPQLAEDQRIGMRATADASFHRLQSSAEAMENGAALFAAAQAVTPISAMIWTIHTGIDDYNTDGLDRMVAKMKDTKAGIIGLLESDAIRMHNGNRDVVEYFSYALGFKYTDYGPTTFDGTFGCALITKYPILYSRRYVLPSPLGELACMIHAKLDLLGVETHVYVGHWGNTQHWADGVLQSQFLGELVQRNPGPSIFLGYLVTKPQEGNYNLYTSATEPGKFRDTALQLYKQRPWRRLTNLGGYVEAVPAEEQQVPEVDQQYHRPPEGADPRYFFFEDTQRYSTAHPRWEYVDRYCQYILYKTGLPQDEKPEHAGQLQPYHFELIDWWRVLDIEKLSDTEIQVVRLVLRAV